MDFNDDENIEWLMESSKTVENVVENDVDFQLREQESLELCNFLQVLRSAFESEPALVDCKAKGTIKSDEDVQKLLKRLKALGYFFSVRHSEKKSDKQGCKLMIVNKKNPPSSHPYRIVSHTHYSCSFKNKESNPTEKSRKYSTCKAVMDLRQIEVFTTISLPSAKRKRLEILRKFRNTLVRNPDYSCETKYVLVISLPKMHDHPRELKGQYLNEEVKAAMHCVLRSGVKSVPEIQQKLYQIVDKDFESESVKPSRENSAFYPNQKIIYNHLRHDGLDTKRVYKQNQNRIVEKRKKISEMCKIITDFVRDCNDEEIVNKIFEELEDLVKSLPS